MTPQLTRAGLRALLPLLLLGGLLLPGCTGSTRSHERSMIILAIDGMDPQLLRRFMDEGRAPNLKALAEEGGFVTLGTANPPQSPVAWSHFITGQGSDVHGIYDFLHRDPHTRQPYLSTTEVRGPDHVLKLGDYVLPLGGGGVFNLREGRPFWELLGAAGVPVSIVKIPADYPPKQAKNTRVLAGMGTPDLLGTPGLFFLYSEDPKVAASRPKGGRAFPLQLGDEDIAQTVLAGPPDPLRPTYPALSVPLKLAVDREHKSALLRIGDSEALLLEGEWSPWLPLSFPAGPLPAIPGMVRAHLRSTSPVTLYLSPINFDPFDAAQPISAPPEFAEELASAAGRYYTQGMPEDTKALEAGALDRGEYLSQSALVFAERRAMLRQELDTFHGGLLFFYFSSVDLVSHMYWRAMTDQAFPEERPYKNAIRDVYERVDDVVGEVRAALPEGAALLVLSDHGFAPFHTKVHLNTWLAEQGFLSLPLDGVLRDEPLGHIDWSATQAYALGLNQLFLNLRGREPGGVVDPTDRDAVLNEISEALLAWEDPARGERVVSRVFRPKPSKHEDRAPDLLIGYNRGYRSSEQSALGEVGDRVLEPNRDRWSGDHCMDPAHVPGVLLSNLAPREGADLLDMAPTALHWFGVEQPAAMTGTPALK